jgi:RNA polymerase sigma factor (sigma-70 family)
MRQHQELAAYYAEEAPSLRRAVAAAVTAPPTLVDDACSYAWTQLVRRGGDIQLGTGAYWWLYRVATREAWRLAADHRRLHPVGMAGEVAALMRDDDGDRTFAAAEYHDAMSSLERVPERQRRLILLCAAGFTYAEVARITGDTVRTVERQLNRGRRTLQQARGE